jgi:hypothetical protein
MMLMKGKWWMIAALGLVVVALAVIYQMSLGQGGIGIGLQSPTPTPKSEIPPGVPPKEDGVACTEEAKLCPDGSYVSRVGPNCEFAPCPVVVPGDEGGKSGGGEGEGVIPEGWQTYTSDEYGFEISYPEGYQALDDANNLYGWPNGVVLIYGGGQAYDVVVEAWDSEVEYKAKYPPGTMNFTATKIGSKWMTVSDQTNEEGNLEVMGSFREIE